MATDNTQVSQVVFEYIVNAVVAGVQKADLMKSALNAPAYPTAPPFAPIVVPAPYLQPVSMPAPGPTPTTVSIPVPTQVPTTTPAPTPAPVLPVPVSVPMDVSLNPTPTTGPIITGSLPAVQNPTAVLTSQATNEYFARSLWCDVYAKNLSPAEAADAVVEYNKAFPK